MFSISRFQTLMNRLPQQVFERAVETHQADKHNKGFSRRSHLVAMIYAQLSGASSLRTVAAGFNAHASHHYHLGVSPVKRSTLADANRKAPVGVFAAVAQALMVNVQRQVRRDAEPLLHLLDSTSFTLKGREFDAWTWADRTRNTQGLKLHVMYDTRRHAPCWVDFSAANVNDIDKARDLSLEAGRCYVFDRGYYNFGWWQAIDTAQAQFVTRFKRNAAIRVVSQRPHAEIDGEHILADDIVTFLPRHNRAGHTHPYQAPLRRVTVHRPDHKTPLILATNDLDSPATVIAERYKTRWRIELFFKWIKQHLRIKQFLGRNENAVKIQILTALIAYLLVTLYRQHSAQGKTLWECLAMLRVSLFQRPHIEAHHQAIYARRCRQRQAAKLQRELFA